MNPRQIIQANLEQKNPPRPGMTFDGGRINDMLVVAVDHEPVKRWVEGNLEFYYDDWGNLWSRMADGCVKGEIRTPFLTDWSRLSELKPPKVNRSEHYASMREKFADAGDLYKVALIGGWIFNDARYLRRMELYLMDLHLYPDELKALHQIIADVYETRIHNAGQLGAEAIFIGEDMGTQTGLLFSPEMFRHFFKELYRRLFDLAHGYGMKILMHSCGYNWQILDDLIEIGVDCFQFDQPALYDMPALAAKFREHHVALWSPVDIQKVLPTGNREFIEKQTRHLIDTFSGGLILKNYPDLPGIGVDAQWDRWAYDAMCDYCETDKRSCRAGKGH
jgi:hypothetical protein